MYGPNRAKFLWRKSGDGDPAVTMGVDCVTVADGVEDAERDIVYDGGGVRTDADAADAADKNPADNCGDH